MLGVRTDKPTALHRRVLSVGKVADVALLSQELRASRRTFAGREGSHRAAVEGDPGIGGLDRGHRCKTEADQQIKGLTQNPQAQSSLSGWAMASAFGRVPGDFRLGEFALRAFENVLLAAAGVRYPVCQFHAGSTHR